MVSPEEIRAFARDLPRSYEAVVRGRLKFRVGSIVWAAFSRDWEVLGFAFPRELRESLIDSDPEKFLWPETSDLRYNWVCVRLAAIDRAEMEQIVIDAWAFCVPKTVARQYAEDHPEV
jgi:hypothetical protein